MIGSYNMVSATESADEIDPEVRLLLGCFVAVVFGPVAWQLLVWSGFTSTFALFLGVLGQLCGAVIGGGWWATRRPDHIRWLGRGHRPLIPPLLGVCWFAVVLFVPHPNSLGVAPSTLSAALICGTIAIPVGLAVGALCRTHWANWQLGKTRCNHSFVGIQPPVRQQRLSWLSLLFGGLSIPVIAGPYLAIDIALQYGFLLVMIAGFVLIPRHPGNRTISITADGLHSKRKVFARFYPWTAVDHVELTDDRLLIHQSRPIHSTIHCDPDEIDDLDAVLRTFARYTSVDR
ncbi:hypothetical protein [Halocatena halophila]|uniref:hypothetical protein n=1 Tax=Halocatena halophila TaxID=2814576 RepID=UPI002ED2D582